MLPKIIVAAHASQFQEGYTVALKPNWSHPARAVIAEYGLLDPHSSRSASERRRLQFLLEGDTHLLVVLMTGMFEEEFITLNTEVPHGRKVRRMVVLNSTIPATWQRLRQSEDLCCVVNLGVPFSDAAKVFPRLAAANLLFHIHRLSAAAQLIEKMAQVLLEKSLA